MSLAGMGQWRIGCGSNLVPRVEIVGVREESNNLAIYIKVEKKVRKKVEKNMEKKSGKKPKGGKTSRREKSRTKFTWH